MAELHSVTKETDNKFKIVEKTTVKDVDGNAVTMPCNIKICTEQELDEEIARYQARKLDAETKLARYADVKQQIGTLRNP